MGKVVIACWERALSPSPSINPPFAHAQETGLIYWRFSCPKSTPRASMLFKTNVDPFSQAGRRSRRAGYELRRPISPLARPRGEPPSVFLQVIENMIKSGLAACCSRTPQNGYCVALRENLHQRIVETRAENPPFRFSPRGGNGKGESKPPQVCPHKSLTYSRRAAPKVGDGSRRGVWAPAAWAGHVARFGSLRFRLEGPFAFANPGTN
jgi:hypothetical protein